MKKVSYDYIKKFFFSSKALKDKYGETKGKEAFDLVDSIIKDYEANKKEQRIKELGLPKLVNIPIFRLRLDTDDEINDHDVIEEAISNFLSDEYGYCLNSFKFEIQNSFNQEVGIYPSDIRVSDIDWDIDD